MNPRRLGDRLRSPWLSTALVVVVAVVVHGPSLAFGFTGLDDSDLIVDDQAFLARPGSILGAFTRSYMSVVDRSHAYYRPFVTASFALDARFSGSHPFGYHLTNVALHVAASVLFLALLRRFALGPVVELAGALAFAVHPALAAAVAWIPGRNDSLLAVFALVAWLLFLRDAAAPSWGARLLHLASFVAALCTKETAVVIPLVLALHVALVEPGAWARLRQPRVAATYAAGWGAAIAGFVWTHPRLGGASGLEVARNVPLVAVSLGTLLLPFNPTAVASSRDLSAWPGLVAAAAIAVTIRLVPGLRTRVVALGMATFALFLAPALAVPGELVLDHRLYLPACGAILMAAEIVRATASARHTDDRLLAGLSAAAVVLLGAVTVAFEGSFRNRRAFAQEAVADSPHSALAHFCLGHSFQIDGDAERALAEYRTALTFAPAEVVHNNIAVLYLAGGRWADAERELRSELTINPNYARAYANLAIALRHEGKLDEAHVADARAEELGVH